MSTSSPRASPPASRRPASSSVSSTSSITRSASARAAATPRTSSPMNSATRRPVAKAASTVPNGDSDSAPLKEATEKIESLMVKVQDKDQTISTLTTENDQLSSALHAAEARMNDLYAEQSRSEMELAQRIDISEKLREQVRELEKEKRDLQRRYNEQTATFDAERQTFYDNEQHLKSRIQTLSQARKQAERPRASTPDPETDVDEEPEDPKPQTPSQTPHQDMNDPDQEPAEMTALRLELSTLSTSHASLQNTLVLLQSQLVDLKRVNQHLQEENESYNILLREKTLSGRLDFLKQVGSGSEDEDDEDDERADAGSLRSTGRNTLDRVEEEQGDSLVGSLGQELERSGDLQDTDSVSSRHRSRPGRKRGASTSHSPTGNKGESLADLPITGPGLDLAAELGRAENSAILAGNGEEDNDRGLSPRKKKNRDRKGGMDASVSTSDVTALRSEVKQLKDANKALSLYASKIIDRIIAQEGFEHVLAADYDKEPTPTTPVTAAPLEKRRPQSVIIDRLPGTPPASTTQFNTPSAPSVPKLGTPPQPSKKAQRRSLSFDWRGFSIFNQGEKKPDPNLRPLTLKPGTSSITSARKLDTEEDEADRRERDRIQATMKLLGITAPASPAPIQKSFSSPAPAPPQPATPTTTAPTPSTNRRFSFFGSRASSNTEAFSSGPSTPALNGAPVGLGVDLTEEAVAAAEAQNTLAALDAQEKLLSEEIAKGSSTGFTEITRRPRTRASPGSRRSGGSGSTVWSAGIEEEE
ncbi:hypothetical protein K435DRAFT_774138 [Dendrothele bispora CBS 962.96]|nr:hypothetical protein K435DRAFT_774138 [Dendrothele bispora CBS 962.96]